MCTCRQREWKDGRRGVERGWCRPHARRSARFFWGAVMSLALLTLPVVAQETVKAEPEAGLKARGQVFWEARMQGGLCRPVWLARTEGAAGDELDQLHPSARDRCSIWRPRSRGCRSMKPKAC